MNIKLPVLIFVCCIIITGSVFGQLKADSILSIYSAQYPQEKLHLHSDKETYLPGETIWFKAYILADDQPTATSTNLYADLLNDKGAIIQHKTMPILSATADSYFILPDTITSNHFVIRAYTTWMLNFDTAFIYHKAITVIDNNKTAPAPTEKPTVSLQFFAEGGNLVSGLYNYVAFKATQSNGLPYNFTAAIKNSKGQLVDSIASIHNGMGMLKLTPEANEAYTAEWKDNKGEYRRTPLPAAQLQGIILHTEQVKNDLYYLINASSNADNLQTLNVLATINQKPVYQAALKMNATATNQKLSTKDFPTGILQLTVFDKNNQPLAERIVFINNNNYSFATAVNIKEKGIAKRAKNTIEIEIPGTLSCNLSLAVYNADLEQQQTNRNIYTDLLLQGDIKGYIYNARWYFNDTATNAKQYLDLVMQTNGWRRYNWDKIIAGQMPSIIYPRDNYLNIYGKAVDNKQQGAAAEMINLILQTKDSAKQWYMPVTNKEGIFTQSGLIFYDTATIFYKLNNSKNKNVGVGISNTYNGLVTINLSANIPSYLQSLLMQEAESNYTKTFITEIKNKNPDFERKTKVLSEVVVKSGAGSRNWKNDPILKMDEKYTNMFRGIGATSYGFDVLHDEMATAKFDIYNYMMGKVPGLKIKYEGGSKQILYPNNFDRSKLIPAIIFVNESEVDNTYLEQINLEAIAYIKFYEQTAWRPGLPPSISIYLRKGDDLKVGQKDVPTNLSKTKIAGYSPIKEFYSPDYSVPGSKQANIDLRTTLYWQPYILTNKINTKNTVSFYNNDITTKLKIVLEGINEEGKLIYIEKIIE